MTNPRKADCFLAAFLIAIVPLALAQGTYTQIDYPGATSTGVFRINNNGVMVGYYADASTTDHGFLLSNGTFSTIDFPGANSTAAVGLNDSGQIVGDYSLVVGVYHGFLLSNQTFTSIDFPGASMTLATDINNAGQIVGVYTDQSGQDHGFELSNGVFVTIEPPGSTFSEVNGINNLGDIVGDYFLSGQPGVQAFVYSRGSFVRHFRVLGAAETAATGINDSREIVGFYQFVSGEAESGYRLKNRHYVRFVFPGAMSTDPFQISNSGVVVGNILDQNTVGHGFTWTPPADATKK